jgi:hypothetical protein
MYITRVKSKQSKAAAQTYDPAPTMDDMDTQNNDTADIAWGVIEVKEVRDGMITTPPPMPHMEAKNPATIPVGTATLFGTYDGLGFTVVERILEITWLFTLLLIMNGEQERTRRAMVLCICNIIGQKHREVVAYWQ